MLVLLCGRTAYQDALYLLRFGVSITQQAAKFAVIGVGQNSPVPQLQYEVRMET